MAAQNKVNGISADYKQWKYNVSHKCNFQVFPYSCHKNLKIIDDLNLNTILM